MNDTTNCQFLTREQTAEFLTQAGFPITRRYLEFLCTAGKGPRVDRWWGRRAMYREETSLRWAELRTRPGGCCST